MKSKKRIFNENFGLNLSKIKGEGYDFAEIVPYIVGEDARKIDWKSTAKTGYPHKKLFFEEREANVALVALMSGSLLFREKKELLLNACALLGYEVLKLSNILMPMIVDESIQILEPSKKLQSVKHFIYKLNDLNLFQKHVYLENLKFKKGAFVILVGDFLGEYDLSKLAVNCDVFVVIIRDSFEENPYILGDREFTDPESGDIAEFFFGKKERDIYAKKYRENDKKLFKHLNRLSIPYIKVTNEKELYRELLQTKCN